MHPNYAEAVYRIAENSIKVTPKVEMVVAGKEVATNSTIADEIKEKFAKDREADEDGEEERDESIHETAEIVSSNASLVKLLHAIGCTVLFGFGRNKFGRFSVCGICCDATGELRCEKKYILNKRT